MLSKSVTHHNLVDPVCGMTIDKTAAVGTSEVDGAPYFFCSSSCKQRFDDDPARYRLKKPASTPRCGCCCH
jgi:Cu+-exporting ATPase